MIIDLYTFIDQCLYYLNNIIKSYLKVYNYIITATAPATLAALTPDYWVLTNQGDAPVSVYIDSVTLQLNLSHYSNEHRILYVLRARNTTPLCHLSDTNTDQWARTDQQSLDTPPRAIYDSNYLFISYYNLLKSQKLKIINHYYLYIFI